MLEAEKTKPFLSIPSKTFLIGEYGVLKGGEALILTHAPYFEIKPGDQAIEFHPNSPAGRVLAKTNKIKNDVFIDPYDGAGGFGASTAEYIYASLIKDPDVTTKELLTDYYNFFEGENEPSGADLCAQHININTEASILKFKKEPLSYKSIKWPFSEVSILIYKTSNKVKTHEHLEKLNLENRYDSLKMISSNLIQSLEAKDKESFFKNLNEFTESQIKCGLLSVNTKNILKSLKNFKGVLGARGCGAMGADVVAVFCDTSFASKVKEQIISDNLSLKAITCFPERG